MPVSKKPRRTKSNRKKSVKVKGRANNNPSQTVFSGFNGMSTRKTPTRNTSATMYGFANTNSSLIPSAEIKRRIEIRKNERPIIVFTDDLANSVRNSKININLKEILITFIDSIKEKLPKRKKLTQKQLQENKSRVLIHLSDFLDLLKKQTEYKKSDIKKINLLIKSLTVNHKLNLKEIKGRISFSNIEFSEATDSSNNSNNWE